jgi:hypothetical protein
VTELPSDELRTELLTIRRLAQWFGVSRNKMPAILKRIEGVEQFGRFYRLKLAQMPVTYLLERGLLRPATFEPDARFRTDSHKPHSRSNGRQVRSKGVRAKDVR